MQNSFQLSVHLHTQPIVHLLSRPQRIRAVVAGTGQIAAYRVIGPYELAHRAISISAGPESSLETLMRGTVHALRTLKSEYTNSLQRQHQAYLEALGQALAIRNGLEHPAQPIEGQRPPLLPVTIATASPELIEVATSLASNPPSQDSPEVLHQLHKQLSRFDVGWRLLPQESQAITDLQAWAEWAETACAKPPLPGLTSAELREVVMSLQLEAA